MLTRMHTERGVSLIELMIGLAIFAMMLVAGAPSFATWLQNTQIRSAAEIIKSGLLLAQTEALRRNTPVRFQLTSSTDNSCALSTTATNWIINVGDSNTNDPSGSCGAAPSEIQAPFIIRSRAATDGTRNVVVSTAQPMILFNSYGRAINLPGASMNIDLTNPTGGDCAANGGRMTCMRLVVFASGQIRMCNPNLPSGTPQGC